MVIDLRMHLESALGFGVASLARLGGGDVAESYRVTLGDGGVVFAKTKRDAPPRFFSTEAAGLAWLGEVDAARIPHVLAVSDDPALLVLEWVELGIPTRSTEAEFGRALAALHGAGAASFGREDRRSTGSRGLPNEPCTIWAEFYGSQRLIPLAKLARDGRALPESAVSDLERVADRLDDLVGPPGPPARLHGDLWAGNHLVDADGLSWLIDPAAFGGHREFDLAMMRLFGGFGEETFTAYAEVTPLADGWIDRIPLNQLAPLVVHAIKFRGGYVAATQRALASLL